MRISKRVALAAALTLAACGREENSTASKKAFAQDANFSLPGVTVSRDAIEIDGVKAFPGSSVESFSSTSNEALAGVKSPNSVEAVKAYYAQQFAQKGVTVTPNGDGFSGKTKDGADFSISVFAKDGVAHATILVHDNPK